MDDALSVRNRSSVSFELAHWDPDDHKVVFENLEHDFPKRFTYHRVADDRLTILLEGEMAGESIRQKLKFERR